MRTRSTTRHKQQTSMLMIVPVLSVLAACAGAPEAPAGPADPVVVDPAHYTVIAETPTVRVLRISYGAGERSTMHYHPDAIAVALTDGTFRMALPDGTTTDNSLPADSADYTPASSHMPENIGSARADVVLVEFKAAAPGSGTLPEAREGVAMSVLAEGPYAAAYRSTAEPTSAEPAGTTHDYDQVVIALAPAEVDLEVDGKLVRSTWTRGDVEFIGRGVPHSATNRGGQAAEYVLVGVK